MLVSPLFTVYFFNSLLILHPITFIYRVMEPSVTDVAAALPETFPIFSSAITLIIPSIL